jgi:hypothetical protein
MRIIFTLFVFFVSSSTLFSQSSEAISKMPTLYEAYSIQKALTGRMAICGLVNSEPPKVDTQKITIRLRCHSTRSNTEPLYILDGVPQEPSTLKNLNPNDIESIEIIKEIAATAIFSCGPRRGIILITTKSSKLRQFTVKDFLDGSKIEGATVTFISAKDKKDTLMFVAAEDGLVKTDRLKTGLEYEVNVSAVGYKQYSVQYKSTSIKEKEFILERDVKSCADVVVVSYGICRCRRSGCGGHWRTVKTETGSEIDRQIFISSATIYPNPAQRGQNITIETLSDNNKAIQVKITDLSGKQLLSQSKQTFKGVNRFAINTDSRWTAGIYIVQVQDEKGKLLQQQKFLIQ